MAAYFASDVHLRLDRPERGRRLARFVGALRPDDSLTLVGDLCDFWYASRQRNTDPMACDGLHALREFRARGGRLTILVGNHDTWLGPFYERTLDARVVAEPWDVEAEGLRLRLVHGHRLGSGPPWKGWLESRPFLEIFRMIPGAPARLLDRTLEKANEMGRTGRDGRLLAGFRGFAASQAPTFDIVVFGHVHCTLDEAAARPRVVVLGGWHEQTSYLKVDHTGASLIVQPDFVSTACNSPS